MHSFCKKTVCKLLALVITANVLLFSFTSCKWFVYVADSKGEITENIEKSSSKRLNDHVADYLRDWGLPLYDSLKFRYVENYYQRYYNYEGGMPDTHAHAKATAELFLRNYFDKIDRDDKSAVTHALLDCYVDALGDPYSVYRAPEAADDYTTDMSGKFGGIGVVVEYDYNNNTIMVNTVYIDSPAEKAGMQAGDYLHAVDGKTISELGITNAVNHIRGEIGSYVNLTLIRDGSFVDVTVQRAEIEEINVDYKLDVETMIAYVRIVTFKGNTFEQFAEAIDALEADGAVGIVFDLRGNPGGYLQSVCDVVSYLVPNDKTIVTYQYKDSGVVRLVSENDETSTGQNIDKVINLPMAVICNKNTASAGEIFTSAIRDYRNEGLIKATIVGTTTYGKGIMQNTYYYIDGSSFTMTVAYYNPPCGVNYHGVGITPDVNVELTDTGDAQLDAALEAVKNLINAN